MIHPNCIKKKKKFLKSGYWTSSSWSQALCWRILDHRYSSTARQSDAPQIFCISRDHNQMTHEGAMQAFSIFHKNLLVCTLNKRMNNGFQFRSSYMVHKPDQQLKSSREKLTSCTLLGTNMLKWVRKKKNKHKLLFYCSIVVVFAFFNSTYIRHLFAEDALTNVKKIKKVSL